MKLSAENYRKKYDTKNRIDLLIKPSKIGVIYHFNSIFIG